MKPLLYIVAAIVGAAAIVCAIFVWVLPVGERVDCIVDGMRVIIPEARGRLPVVFFAHNGGGTKGNWGGFPDGLGKKGYAVGKKGRTGV